MHRIPFGRASETPRDLLGRDFVDKLLFIEGHMVFTATDYSCLSTACDDAHIRTLRKILWCLKKVRSYHLRAKNQANLWVKGQASLSVGSCPISCRFVQTGLYIGPNIGPRMDKTTTFLAN